MKIKYSLKRALVNHGPVRNGNTYLVGQKNDEYIVIVTTFLKTTFHIAKMSEIEFIDLNNDYEITSEMIYEMLHGIKYYAELSDPIFYKDKIKPMIHYSRNDFFELMNIYKDGLDLDKANTLFELCMVYLYGTYEGAKVIADLITNENPNLNDDNIKVASMLYSIYKILKNDKRTLIDVSEFIDMFKNSEKITEPAQFVKIFYKNFERA